MEYLNELFGLDGKVALVTGAGRGIGRALATALAGAGATVACSDVDEEAARETAAAIEDQNGRALALHIDCAEDSSIVAGVAATADKLGRLDVLVNNAGIYPYESLEDMETNFLESVFRVNVLGTMVCMQEAVKVMKASGGAIVNLSSITSQRAVFPGEGAYGPSKAAVSAMTRNAAKEFGAYGITVNAVAPGGIRTEGTNVGFELGLGDILLQRQPLQRIGEPEDLAGIVIALAARAGRFITGTTIVIDGGYIVS